MMATQRLLANHYSFLYSATRPCREDCVELKQQDKFNNNTKAYVRSECRRYSNVTCVVDSELGHLKHPMFLEKDYSAVRMLYTFIYIAEVHPRASHRTAPPKSISDSATASPLPRVTFASATRREILLS
jgi:hypothetical protein